MTSAVQPSPVASAAPAGAGNDVVVQLMDGGEMRGTIQSFNSRLPTFVLQTEGGAKRVTFESVKTVAFPRPGGEASQRSGISSNARLVTVRFRDDTLLRGVSENFGGPRAGMFLVPTNCAGVDRFYVPVSAVRDMESVQRIGDILTEQKSITLEMLERALSRQQELRQEPIGEILLRNRAIEPEQLEASLTLQRQREGSRIGEILMEQGFISREELEGALESQKHQRDRRLGEVMIELGYTSYKMIGIALSIQYDLPFLSLASPALEPSLRDLLRKEEALQWQLLPLSLENDLLTVAVADPRNSEFTEILERRSGAVVAVVVSTPQDIRRLIGVLYPRQS